MGRGADDQRTFALFCTINCGFDDVWLFAEVADEIAAVEAFRSHVANYGADHIPHIHMEPMRAEWGGRYYFAQVDIDPAANLFRQPAEARS